MGRPHLPVGGQAEIGGLQDADQRRRLPGGKDQDGREEHSRGDAHLLVQADVERELEGQDPGHHDRGDQPPVGALAGQPAERGQEGGEGPHAYAQPVELRSPSRRHGSGLA